MLPQPRSWTAPKVRVQASGGGVDEALRKILRQADRFAAEGRWRKLIEIIPEDGQHSAHPKLVKARLHAAIELNDDRQVQVCTSAAIASQDVGFQVQMVALLTNAWRAEAAASILETIAPEDLSPKALNIARRIIKSEIKPDMRERLKQLIDGELVASDKPTPTVHAFSSALGAKIIKPGEVAIVRLPHVDAKLEDMIRATIDKFSLRLKQESKPAIHEYENVFINTLGEIWTADGRYIKPNNPRAAHRIDPTSVPVFEEAFTCIGRTKGYYDWLTALLPVLSWPLAPETPDCPIVVREEQQGLIRSTLASIGVPAGRIVPISGTVFVRRLYLGRTSMPALAQTDTFQHTYGRLLEAAKRQDRGDTPKRFFISRRDSKRRSMSNEIEFESGITARGFTPIVLSELGLLDKINLFRNADIVIGAHGAGLAHLVFAKPNLRVIEMMPVTMNQYSQMGYRIFFSLLSSVFGLNHTTVLHPMNPSTSEWASDPEVIADIALSKGH